MAFLTIAGGIYSSGAEGPVYTWTSRTSSFGATSINGVHNGGQYWTAVGGSGKLATASDPTGTWTQRTSSFGATNIYSLHFNKEIWVSVGNTGKLATATDPTGTWTQRTSGHGTDIILGVTYGSDGYWVTCGGASKIATATDPTGTWTSRANPFTSYVYKADFDGTTWCAVGGVGQMATATDPTGTWTSRTSSFGSDWIGWIHYANGIWVAVGGSGKLATATDPTGTWTQRTNPIGSGDTITEVDFDGTYWRASARSGKVIRATDPTGTWILETTNFGSNDVEGIATDGNMWVAVGDGGKLDTLDSDNIVPAKFIQNTDHNISDYIWTVKYGSDGYWCIGGEDSSGNGVIDYRQTNPTGTFTACTSGFGANDVRAPLSYDGSTYWTAGGYSGKFRYKATPPSGSWSDGTDIPGIGNNLYGMDYGNGYWVAGADDATMFYKTSVSGAWSTVTEPFTAGLRFVKYGSDGYWVAGAQSNQLATSGSVPSTFTSRTSPFGASDYVLFGDCDGTRWVITSSNGDIAYTSSPPTGGWTIVSNPGPFVNGEWINNIAYGNGVWVICGSNGKLATATDPTSAGNWTQQTIGFGTSFATSVSYGNGYWVVGGYGTPGKLAYSQVST